LTLLLEGVEVFAEGGQLVLLLVELIGVALGEGSLFGSAFESGEVFADAFLVPGDLVDLGLFGFDLGIEGGYGALGGEDRFELLTDGRIGVAKDDGELLIGVVNETIMQLEEATLADVEANGFAGSGGDAKTVGGGSGLGGLRVGVEVPALAYRLFDNDSAGIGGSIVDDVLHLGDLAGLLSEDASDDGEGEDALRVVRVVGRDGDGGIGGVGEEAALVGMDGVDETLASEVAVLNDGEAASVEGEVGGVSNPEGAQRAWL